MTRQVTPIIAAAAVALAAATVTSAGAVAAPPRQVTTAVAPARISATTARNADNTVKVTIRTNRTRVQASYLVGAKRYLPVLVAVKGTAITTLPAAATTLMVRSLAQPGAPGTAWIAVRIAAKLPPKPAPKPTPGGGPVLRGFEFIPDATTCYLEPQIDKYSAFSGLFARVRFAIRVDKTDPDASVVVAAPAFGGHFTDWYKSGSLHGDVPHTSDPVTGWYVEGVPVSELPVTISSLTFTTEALGLNTTPSAPRTLTAATPLTIDTSACTNFVPPTAPAAVSLKFVRGSGDWAQLQVNWQTPVGGLWAEGTWSPINSYTAVVTGSDGSSQTVRTPGNSAIWIGNGHFEPSLAVAVPKYQPGVTYTAVGYASNGAGTSPPSAPVRVTVPADAPRVR